MQKPINDVTQFHSVDQTTNPTFFAQFMHTSHALQAAQTYKQEMRTQLAIQEGATLLDVGCGAGQDAQDLARAVGPRAGGGKRISEPA